MASLLRVVLIYMLLPLLVLAKDFGVHGHIFEIQEKDLLHILQSKAKAVSQEEMEAFHKKVQERFILSFTESAAVNGIMKAVHGRVFTVDPTFTAPSDITDHKEQILIKKGTQVNPLKKGHILPILLFFDAMDPQQIEWAKKQTKRAEWVLVRGNPFELERSENRPIYFDQLGLLSRDFKIKHIPAIVSQENELIRVEEVALSQEKNS